MMYFDCSAYFGLPSRRPLLPVPRIEDLLAEMEHAGISKALVWHIAQHDASPQAGNQLLADSIAPHDNLFGCWAVLPNQAHEFPGPVEFLARMQSARIRAVRMFPGSQKFLLNRVAMGDWLEVFSAYRIPVLLSMQYGVDWQTLYAVLNEFPELVTIICDHGCWGEDRLFRPLLERYPNVYVDTAQYLLDGGIEALVHDYGDSRLVFGSGFPNQYMGGMMMAIQHARISHDARTAIAGGNLERILAQARFPGGLP